MYYEEDIVEQVRQSNDIVDVISSYVNLKDPAVITWDYVHFTMKNRHLFPSVPVNRCTIVSDVVREEMFLPF